jgi:hypothetical protein
MKNISAIVLSITAVVFISILVLQINENNGITGFYVYTSDYKGIEIKFYNASVESECVKLLDLVPDKYLTGLSLIKVLPFGSSSIGHYYESGILELFGCSFDGINHELAHHVQNMQNDSSYNLTHHLGQFSKIEREIFEEMWANQHTALTLQQESPQGFRTGLAIQGLTTEDNKMENSSLKNRNIGNKDSSIYDNKNGVASNPFMNFIIICIAAIVATGFIFDYGSILYKKLIKK